VLFVVAFAGGIQLVRQRHAFLAARSLQFVGNNDVQRILVRGDDLEHVSWTLGASWSATFLRIIVPLAIRAIIVVGLIGFISSARNISHLALLSSSDNRPLALLQLEYMVEGRYEAASVIGAVVAEWAGASSGLGVLINIADQGLFDTPLMFVALVTLAVIGIGLHGLVVSIERRLHSLNRIALIVDPDCLVDGVVIGRRQWLAQIGERGFEAADRLRERLQRHGGARVGVLRGAQPDNEDHRQKHSSHHALLT